MPFYIKKQEMDNLMCLLEFKCAKRLKAHSQALPADTYASLRLDELKQIMI